MATKLYDLSDLVEETLPEEVFKESKLPQHMLGEADREPLEEIWRFYYDLFRRFLPEEIESGMGRVIPLPEGIGTEWQLWDNQTITENKVTQLIREMDDCDTLVLRKVNRGSNWDNGFIAHYRRGTDPIKCWWD